MSEKADPLIKLNSDLAVRSLKTSQVFSPDMFLILHHRDLVALLYFIG